MSKIKILKKTKISGKLKIISKNRMTLMHDYSHYVYRIYQIFWIISMIEKNYTFLRIGPFKCQVLKRPMS